MSKLVNLYASRYRGLVHEAQTHPLVFRRNAQIAFENYSRRDRTESARLSTDSADTLSFYQAWEHTLLPQLETIESAVNSKPLHKEIAQRLLLNDAEATERIAQLVRQRTADLTEQLITELYKPNERKARKYARRFITRRLEQNLANIEHYVEYGLYKLVAREERMTIYDRHALFMKRLVQAVRAFNQERTLIRRTKRQLRHNNRLMSTIEQQNDGLIASLFALRIDLVAIRSAYQSYEKALKKLSETARKSPSKQLSLYEKETADLRASHLESVAGIHRLQDIQRAAAEIDAVLLRIFDLDNRRYNELMSLLKQYRDLQREQKQLTQRLKKER